MDTSARQGRCLWPVSYTHLAALYPDTTYAYESGGDPEFITDLTYESYLEFYHTYYHPSNSYIYLYGDLDMEKALNWMDHEYLSHYEKKEIDSAVTLQKPFNKMKEISLCYAASELSLIHI